MTETITLAFQVPFPDPSPILRPSADPGPVASSTHTRHPPGSCHLTVPEPVILPEVVCRPGTRR